MISGNAGAGIEIGSGSTNNNVVNNQIGFIGNTAVGVQQYGVFLNNVSGNTIGGTSRAAGQANTISGNVLDGVLIANNAPGHAIAGPGNTVRNNFIGTNPQGSFLAPGPIGHTVTQSVGVLASNSTGNTITGNVLSGNATAGA